MGFWKKISSKCLPGDLFGSVPRYIERIPRLGDRRSVTEVHHAGLFRGHLRFDRHGNGVDTQSRSTFTEDHFAVLLIDQFDIDVLLSRMNTLLYSIPAASASLIPVLAASYSITFTQEEPSEPG